MAHGRVRIEISPVRMNLLPDFISQFSYSIFYGSQREKVLLQRASPSSSHTAQSARGETHKKKKWDKIIQEWGFMPARILFENPEGAWHGGSSLFECEDTRINRLANIRKCKAA
jgi:hypothetical protein